LRSRDVASANTKLIEVRFTEHNVAKAILYILRSTSSELIVIELDLLLIFTRYIFWFLSHVLLVDVTKVVVEALMSHKAIELHACCPRLRPVLCGIELVPLFVATQSHFDGFQLFDYLVRLD